MLHFLLFYTLIIISFFLNVVHYFEYIYYSIRKHVYDKPMFVIKYSEIDILWVL